MIDSDNVVMAVRMPVEMGKFAKLLRLAAEIWPGCTVTGVGSVVKIILPESKPEQEAQ